MQQSITELIEMLDDLCTLSNFRHFDWETSTVRLGPGTQQNRYFDCRICLSEDEDHAMLTFTEVMIDQED